MWCKSRAFPLEIVFLGVCLVGLHDLERNSGLDDSRFPSIDKSSKIAVDPQAQFVGDDVVIFFVVVVVILLSTRIPGLDFVAIVGEDERVVAPKNRFLPLCREAVFPPGED